VFYNKASDLDAFCFSIFRDQNEPTFRLYLNGTAKNGITIIVKRALNL